MKWYAALELNGKKVLVPSRKHNYHATRGAAIRQLEKISKQLAVNARGYIWNSDSNFETAFTISL